jgi:hypothetical protein
MKRVDAGKQKCAHPVPGVKRLPNKTNKNIGFSDSISQENSQSLPIFRLRIWHDTIMRAVEDYAVTAETIADAALLLVTTQKKLQRNQSMPYYHPRIVPIGQSSGMIRAIHPDTVAGETFGVCEINHAGKPIRGPLGKHLLEIAE